MLPAPQGLGDQFSVAIGVDTNGVITGAMGSVAPKQLYFPIIRDTVNRAQCLQLRARPSQILIVLTTLPLLPAPGF
ncbi:hypothetical protein K3G63_08540 [Hymenobacter sp. HSC-4F20]|uniref:hypothetical protein n=1 Tax=Hymenobacter sp. HSC-4F20 TaxID=2864135 RepID=UPI001C72DF9A|nr:hypothetical protein [Hymenobacter sp. HSC-4F20]MBX0290482.1 hypothetical protein [Hymenobacter sp. HSC-4F20]